MSVFSAWILSIVGIAMLGTLVDLIQPDGNMRKYVKVVFSFIVIFVIISPLPKLMNGQISLQNFFGQSDNTLIPQQSFIIVVNAQKKLYLENDIKEALEIQGISNAKAEIVLDLSKEEFEIKKIFINLKDAVISEKIKHINIPALVSSVVKNLTGLKEELIVVNE